MNRQHDPLMSPLVWDLGHLAAFEDLWVCRETGLEAAAWRPARVY
ncbi:MAG: DinB family protein, partial [Actinomycetota bacterium]|nr:DinB family protein [Actinomycetota bacterium]